MDTVPAPVPDDVAGIMEILKSEPDRYWRDEGLRSRALRLCGPDAEGRPAPAEVSKAEDTASELAQMEVMVGDHDSPYWKGARSEQLQARFKHLVLQREGVPDIPADADEPGAWRAPVEVVAKALPAALVEEFRASEAGLEGNVRQLQDVGLVLGKYLEDPETVMDFQASLAGLSDGAQAALYREAARGVPAHIPPATPEQMEAFRRIDCGIYTDAWGHMAERRVATVFARWQRGLAEMSGPEQESFKYWFDNISPKERSALLWMMSGA